MVQRDRYKISELRRLENNYIYKKRFPLFGTVERLSKDGKSVLISKLDTGVQYWANIREGLELTAGQSYRFDLTISTFIAKDGTIKTSLRAMDVVSLEKDEDSKFEGDAFADGHMSAKILHYKKTEIKSLYIITLRRMEEGEERETYHMRYYQEFVEDGKDKLFIGNLIGKSMVVKFTLIKSKYQINEQGEIHYDMETREYTNEDGQEIKIQSAVYIPTLAIKQIIT